MRHNNISFVRVQCECNAHPAHTTSHLYKKRASHQRLMCARYFYRENMMLTTQYKTMNPPVYKNMRNKNGATCKMIHPKIK